MGNGEKAESGKPKAGRVDDTSTINRGLLDAGELRRPCRALSGWFRATLGSKYQHRHGAGQHDLPQLASATGFQIDALETDLLRRLSHFIQYGGRYPVPRDASQLMLIRSPGGGRGAATSWSTGTDQNSFDEIVRRLGTLL